MQTLEIISAIDELPLEEKHLIVERTLQLIKKQESDHQMSKAAEALRAVYVNDSELTVFTSLDSEPFYEYEAE